MPDFLKPLLPISCSAPYLLIRRSAGNWTVVHGLLSLTASDVERHVQAVKAALPREVANLLESAQGDKQSARAAAVGLPLEQAAARGTLDALQLGTEFRFLPQLPGAFSK